MIGDKDLKLLAREEKIWATQGLIMADVLFKTAVERLAFKVAEHVVVDDMALDYTAEAALHLDGLPCFLFIKFMLDATYPKWLTKTQEWLTKTQEGEVD